MDAQGPVVERTSGLRASREVESAVVQSVVKHHGRRRDVMSRRDHAMSHTLSAGKDHEALTAI